MALGLSRGSEANVPLGRAVLGGLLAGLATTLFVVPCVYSLFIPNRFEKPRRVSSGSRGFDSTGSDPRFPSLGEPPEKP